MNAICKVVWSQVHQQLVVVSELVKAGGKTHSRRSGAGSGVLVRPTTLAMAMALGLGLTGASAQTASNALPASGNVAAGTASISRSGANMVIDQSTQRAVINWQSFNVGKDAHVQFNNGSGATLNRVTGPEASTILGRISATGQITISNGNGVFFGPGSRVDVGSLVATTHSISDAAFMAGGNLRFERNGSTASVVNEGELSASLQGYVALLAPEVRNSGVMVASKGTVALAAGEAITLQINAQDQLQGVVVDAGDWKALVDNRHVVEAEGGLVILSARALQSVQGGVVRHSGSISASSLTQVGGRILLTGDDITLTSGSNLTATGATGGGEVYVGGGWQGGGIPSWRGAPAEAIHQATKVTMERGATIDASATDNGTGGTAVLWSDIGGSTTFAGQILARGGAQAGRGGRVETSGHSLQIETTGHVDTTAAQGATGDWLIDPVNFSISAGTGAQTSNSIGASTLVASLALNNVTIATSGDTTGFGDITVASNVVSSSANSLTLKAHRNITHSAGVTVSTAGGAVTYWADSDNNATGNIIFSGAATINTGGGNLTLAGGADSGAGTPQGSAVRIIAAEGVGFNRSFNTVGGNVLLKASGPSVGFNAIDLSGVSIDSGAGSITIEGVNSGTNPTTSNGIYLKSGTTLASSKTSGTAISISGEGSYGLTMMATGADAVIVKATGGGNINISNTAIGVGSNRHLYFLKARVLTSTGDITINSNEGVASADITSVPTIIGKLTGHVESSSSNITINTDNMTGGNLSFDTSGQVTIQPFGSSFTGLTTGYITWAPSITGLTLGKSGNTGNIAVASAISISGPIAIYSSGTVTQTAALTAPSLALYGNSGVGNFTLNHASNNIGTVAASGVGNLSYWDSNALTIGTVGSIHGIVAAGTVDIQTLTGDLTVAQNVSTTNTTSSALLLNAGKSAAAGTASGGNVVLSGSPTISGGAGSTVKVYTGQLTSTDNPNSWVGQGLGRFRYNADELTNFATGTWTNLGAGTYVIYRERPSANITTANTSMEYGDALPGMTATGMVNGDLASYSVTSPVYQGSTGRLVPGTYVTTGSLAGLGYNVSGSSSGNLAVSPRTVG